MSVGEELPLLREWMEAKCGLNVEDKTPSQVRISIIHRYYSIDILAIIQFEHL